MTRRVEVTLRFVVEVDDHRYRATQADIGKSLLKTAQDEVRNWMDYDEIERAPNQYEPDEWRGYEWTVAAVRIGSEPAETTPCGNCGRPIDHRPGSGRQRRYCTDACRQAAYRQRDSKP